MVPRDLLCRGLNEVLLIASVVTGTIKTIKDEQIKGDGMTLWPFQWGI